MTIHLLRHAEKQSGSYYNTALRHEDPPVTAGGGRLARRLAGYFMDKGIRFIGASQYVRTQQTARSIAMKLDLVPRIDARLNEIDNGMFEGLSHDEIMSRYPDVWKAYQERNRDFRFPRGETGEEARARVMGLLEELAGRQGNALLVTHDGLMRIALCSLLRLEVYRRWEFSIDILGIMEIELDQESRQWRLRRFNQALLSPSPQDGKAVANRWT